MTTAVFPPGPQGRPIVGSLFEFRKNPLAFAVKAIQEYGDIVHCRAGPKHVFLLAHPDHVKDILVTHQHRFVKGRGLQWAKRFLGEGLLTSEGEFHTRQRRLSQPAFHRQRVSTYGHVMTEYAARLAGRWDEGKTVDMAHEMMALTMAIAGKTLFDTDVEAEAPVIRESLTTIMRFFPRFTLPFPELLHRLPLPSNRRFEKARARLDVTIYRMIDERRRAAADRGDLLSMLMLAQDEEGTGGMSDAQLRDEIMTLFLAGHETTANALTWTFYLLSENPGPEARLHAELDAVLSGRRPAAADLARLTYTEHVLAESMRLYPPAWGLGRRAVVDHPIDGYVMPADSLAFVSPFITQRDPRWFPEPLRFDPDRWLPERKAARPRFSYFPFGGGARQCIGEPFAWMEGVLVLATLAQQWRARLVPGHSVEPEVLITLRPRYGMKMTLTRRGS